MRKNSFTRIPVVLFVAIALLVAVLLVYLWLTPNLEVTHSRESSGYQAAQNVAGDERLDDEGRLVRQFRFSLDEVVYDTTLSFFFSHQNAVVYLDGEAVYSLRVSPRLSIIRTPGYNWAMIPLCREDAGAEVLVELTPVYENYRSQQIEFYIGSRYAVFTAQLLRSLPEMLLSFINILAGIILLCAAVYFSCRHVDGRGLYTLALLAVSLGGVELYADESRAAPAERAQHIFVLSFSDHADGVHLTAHQIGAAAEKAGDAPNTRLAVRNCRPGCHRAAPAAADRRGRPAPESCADPLPADTQLPAPGGKQRSKPSAGVARRLAAAGELHMVSWRWCAA